MSKYRVIYGLCNNAPSASAAAYQGGDITFEIFGMTKCVEEGRIAYTLFEMPRTRGAQKLRPSNPLRNDQSSQPWYKWSEDQRKNAVWNLGTHNTYHPPVALLF
ncbi:7841_t:CDS:2 [Acaulospora morrowiae]|uniref:7841_t:CDS:1 n=1 Tax=Acaulospora morrowiae TaxID=94023 RepID=A0A9N9GG15_9GLOM|nr:7841_t:CDS:2 [Acaulospora morrowiae]